MKFRFIQSPEYEVIAYGKEKNETINLIESICNQDEIKLIGYHENIIKELNPNLVECFFTECDKVYAIYESKKYQVKKRLYELYDKFGKNFVYINQGCLVNFSYIDYFESTLTASLKVTLKSGYKDFVSRRMLKNIKERIGLINEKNH